MSRRARRRGSSLLGLALLLAAALAAGLAAYAEHTLSALVLGGLGESFSTKLYSAPYRVAAETAAPPERLIERLKRLGYRGAPAAESPGDFSWKAPSLTACLRGFKSASAAQQPGCYRLTWKDAGWDVRDSSGAAAGEVLLEPELVAELSGAKMVRREPALAAEIPETLKNAVIAAEDKRFYSHWGIDWRAAARALRADLTGGGALQGGSTITQQIAKNIFLSPRRTFQRKLAEAALAFYLELRYSKERILTLYLNHIYLGQDGPTSVAGVKAAARFYFDKDLRQLGLGDCAVLAGLIRSPHRYNPFHDPEESRRRRDFVLRRMRTEGMISERELAAAQAQPLALRRLVRREKARDGDYFTAEVLRELLPRYGEEAIFRHGLSLYTTMDPLLQRQAQRAVRSAARQAALAALDPRDGAVLALSGGKDFGESQFNRATQAQRQPGSAFKPFVYGAALEKGFTPATLLLDEPRDYPGASGGSWRPENYDGVYYGTTTLRQALAHSLNAATLDLAEQVGTGNILAFARKLGIQSPLQDNLATPLGASEANLLELSAAYAAFANGGFKVRPRLVSAVVDAEGNVLEFEGLEREAVLAPPLAYLMTSLLEGVVSEGTARGLSRLGWTRPSAGKTGTTNDGRDAWFIGYTPRLVAGVWVGDDGHRAAGLTGAKDAVPLWASFMKDAAIDAPPDDFVKPEGLVTVAIDPLSGLKARSGCPVKRRELFLAGTEPQRSCPLHPGGIFGWFKRIFGKT